MDNCHTPDCPHVAYEASDPVTDLFIAPREQRGIVFSVRFPLDEADAVSARAEFWGLNTIEYIRRLVCEDAGRPAVKIGAQSRG